MVKVKLIVLLLLGSAIQAVAQNMKLALEKDSTFNAAEDYAKTIDGFDVDITKINVINIGAQLAYDIAASNVNNKEMEDALDNKSYYRQRVDIMLSSALPERTNIYSNISFINNSSDVSSVVVSVTNLEVEHFFMNHFKFRVGRLANSVSESQFFGRMALEESSAHVFGRKLFINDALELDGNFLKQNGPVFFVGLKPQFKPFNLKSVYAGLHKPFKSGMQLHSIFSLNRQFEADMLQYIPDFRGKQAYFSYEFEVAYKSPTRMVFLNVGGSLGYQGLLPHTGGNFDLMKQLAPVVMNKKDSFKETFTPSWGFRIHPAKMSPQWKILPQAGLEAEIQGTLTDRFTVLNLCAYCKLNLTRRMILTYYCTPQFVWQSFNETGISHVGGVINYLRLSVTVGKPSRMFI